MPTNPILGTSSVIVGQDESLPYDGQGQALAQAGQAIAGAFGEIKTRTLQNDLQAVTDEAIATAQAELAAAEKPITSDVIAQAIGGTADQVDDPDNAVIRPVLESIARLKRANQQGAINVDELKIRQENILRDAIARHPLYAAQFIQGAGQQLGYNPIGSTVDAIGASRSRLSAPKTKADEIEEYYERQGDLLNVDRTLKFSNPAAWYAQVQREIAFNQRLQHDNRTYQLQVTTRQITEERALQQLRSVNMPQYGRKVVTDLMNAARHFATMSPEQRNQAIKNGELDQLRTQIAAARVGLLNHVRDMNGNLENYLTTTQIQEASRDVLGMLDFAEKATDPVAALQGIKTHLEAVTLNNVDFKFPEFGTMERVVGLLGRLPNDSLISKKFSEEMSSAVAMGLNNMIGTIINSKDPADFNPMFVIPPEVAPNLPPADRAEATRRVLQGVQMNLKAVPADPYARRAFVRSLGAFSTEYVNSLRQTGQAPDEQTSQQLVNMAASDEFKAIITDPNVSIADMTGLTNMNEMLAAEAMDTGVEIGQDIRTRSARSMDSIAMNQAMRRSPYASFDPDFQRMMNKPSVALSEVLRIEWREGRAQIVPIPENDIVLQGKGLDYDSLKKTAAMLNSKYSRRLTSLVRASAHSAASDDYSNAAVILDGLLNNVRYTIAE